MRLEEAFARYACLLDEETPLLEAAMSIALIEYPELYPPLELQKFESLKTSARAWVGRKRTQESILASFNDYFFEQLGFRGEREDYHNPRNSFLNQVLETKRGIPISISVIYVEMAKSIGLDAYGVSFPGHFLVGCSINGRRKLIDAFNGGTVLTSAELRGMLSQTYEGKIELDEIMLARTCNKSILLRMLGNLEEIYLENRELRKVLEVVRVECVLNPESPEQIKKRGLLNYQLQNYDSALADLAEYLRRCPDSSDSSMLRDMASQVRSNVEGWV